MYAFLVEFARSLPCEQCRQHFVQMVATDLRKGIRSPALLNRAALTKTAVDWHNAVNRRIGHRTLTYERVRYMYRPVTTDDTSRQGWVVVLCLVAIALVRITCHARCNGR